MTAHFLKFTLLQKINEQANEVTQACAHIDPRWCFRSCRFVLRSALLESVFVLFVFSKVL